MAFFDELGKKLSQASQNVAQKTKDFTEVSKLNGAISDEEKKINNISLQLGKEYYAKHVGDYEACFEQYVVAIKEAEEKIAMLRQQIETIKGVVRCEKCGAELQNNVPFCNNCGAPAPVKNPVMNPAGVVCSACGQIIPAGTKFCTSCGTPVAPVMPYAEPTVQAAVPYTEPVSQNVTAAENPAQSVEPVAETVEYAPTENVSYAVAAEPAAPASNLCPNCNAELLPGTAFCVNCGAKLG